MKFYEHQYLIYRHITLDDEITFYVGKDEVWGNRAHDGRSRNDIHESITKRHGIRVEVLEFCDRELLRERERYWIANLHTCICYEDHVLHASNKSAGGDTTSGYVWTKEQREKLSKIKIGLVVSDEVRKSIQNTLTGRKDSKEICEIKRKAHNQPTYLEKVSGKNNSQARAVEQWSKDCTTLIAKFDTIKEASIITGGVQPFNTKHHANCIGYACRNNEPYYGFLWKYVL